ncbi:MAG: hypothetical protein M3460_28140 [Actinomycetota bacterium]|nr:hypothetical protein [Actinomycetota bacterium]
MEFHWLPFDQLADTDIQPGAIKNALLATGDDQTPFWHGWNAAKACANRTTAVFNDYVDRPPQPQLEPRTVRLQGGMILALC